MDAPPRTIAEAARQVPLRAAVDVLVCGGGLERRRSSSSAILAR